MPNLFDDIPDGLPQELLETLLTGNAFRAERIVSRGHASPPGFWYDQDRPEWVILLRGRARLQFEGEEPALIGPGDYVNIPAHKRHRVDWTAPDVPTVWLALHYDEPNSEPL